MFDWLKPKKPAAKPEPSAGRIPHEELPSSYVEPERYKGRPLLSILENYVLSCIGALTPEQEAGMAAIVQRVWQGSSDWKKTVREHLDMKDTLDQSLRDMWARNLEAAKRGGKEIHPVQFAKLVADKNFVHMFDGPK